jgi:hypothetical protein
MNNLALVKLAYNLNNDIARYNQSQDLISRGATDLRLSRSPAYSNAFRTAETLKNRYERAAPSPPRRIMHPSTQMTVQQPQPLPNGRVIPGYTQFDNEMLRRVPRNIRGSSSPESMIAAGYKVPNAPVGQSGRYNLGEAASRAWGARQLPNVVRPASLGMPAMQTAYAMANLTGPPSSLVTSAMDRGLDPMSVLKSWRRQQMAGNPEYRRAFQMARSIPSRGATSAMAKQIPLRQLRIPLMALAAMRR